MANEKSRRTRTQGRRDRGGRWGRPCGHRRTDRDFRGRFAAFVTAFVALSMAGGTVFAETPLGFLQFKVEHNLESPACLAGGNCALTFEALDSPAPWLAQIRAASGLAVLHWDRALPWLVFDRDPPVGVDPVVWFDARLDAPTVAYVDAFAAHFAALEKGYLAVSILSGQRDRLAPLHLAPGRARDFATRCPSFAPGTQPTIDPGNGPQTFDLARSYRNFVLYLARKLEPDYVALMVEANLIETTCPARAAELYALYRAIHDEVESALGPAPLLFATLSLPPLLAYDRAACYPTAAFVSCNEAPLPPAIPMSEGVCFPTNPTSIDALALGGRLDVLALSFYPDGLEMRRVPSELPRTRAFLVPDWNSGGACTAALSFSEAIDPMAAIDRLGWTGPIAIAETSARSCATPLYLEVPGTGGATPYVFEAPGSAASQAGWVAHTYHAAVDRDALFYVHAFLRDYPPIGTWIAEQGILAPELQSLLNTWPCSGLQDPSGAWKPEMLAIGLPEPASGVSFGLGVVGLFGLASGRSRRRRRGESPVPLQFGWQSPKRRATQRPSGR